jgi:hypothetical protein
MIENKKYNIIPIKIYGQEKKRKRKETWEARYQNTNRDHFWQGDDRFLFLLYNFLICSNFATINEQLFYNETQFLKRNNVITLLWQA